MLTSEEPLLEVAVGWTTISCWRCRADPPVLIRVDVEPFGWMTINDRVVETFAAGEHHRWRASLGPSQLKPRWS